MQTSSPLVIQNQANELLFSLTGDTRVLLGPLGLLCPPNSCNVQIDFLELASDQDPRRPCEGSSSQATRAL